jgi:hypothetical protein
MLKQYAPGGNDQLEKGFADSMIWSSLTTYAPNLDSLICLEYQLVTICIKTYHLHPPIELQVSYLFASLPWLLLQ